MSDSRAAADRAPVYFDDLQVGQRIRTAAYTIDAAQIETFARQFDPQPFHLDPLAAKGTFFGQLVASGWHTAAVTMRLLVESGFPLAGGVVGAGVEIRWTKPVLPGDTLYVVSEVAELKPSRSHPNRGMVTLTNTTFNQRDEPVQTQTAHLVVQRRPG